MSIVIVKELPKKTWHGKTGKESFSAPKKIEALYSEEVGGYDTGLTEDERVELELKLGLDLSNTFNPEEPHPFWGSKAGAFELTTATQTFDTKNPRDLIKVKLMKRNRKVANSYKEWEEGLFPDATHYIHDEVEEAEVKATKLERRTKATIVADGLSLEAKVKLIMLLNGKNYKGKKPSTVTVEIAELIETDAEEFLRYHAMGSEEVTIRAQILEMIQRNILTKDGTAVYYMSDQIGFDFDAAVRYLKDPANAKLRVLLLERLDK